ncbi:hypothetical protein OG21DRAFT_1500310 [Imleria badia]|nr:hypothetical protein OG21DRAFT_1500310 [Imleria badia]
MPAIPSVTTNLHPDVHRWPPRQSSTSVSTSSSGLPSSITTAIAIIAVVVVLTVAWHTLRCQCKRKAQRATRVASRPGVQAPPGSQLEPIIAEILAATLSQAGAAARAPASSCPPAYGDAQDPARVTDLPSQPAPSLTNNLPAANDDYRTRTTLGAGVTQVDSSTRTSVTHQDALDDDAAPVELPPPYSLMTLA